MEVSSLDIVHFLCAINLEMARLGYVTETISSDWSSSVGNFIFSNGIQSSHTQVNSEIIDSQSK